tara:strand:- start:354 stop:569 length:216 start_codon:yes stop_codon:yes gene_type:complete
MNILTRKQKWRRCNNMIFNRNQISPKNEIKPIVEVKKKVTFNNTVYLTLIPTRHELNELQKYLEKSNMNKK